MNDKISELIINIKNAGRANLPETSVPFSNLKKNILSALKKKGFIEDFSTEGEEIKKNLVVKLKYIDGKHKIEDVKRVSKLSKRIYFGYKEIKPVKFGKGTLVLSTPLGILTDKEARDSKIGGEALFKIW